MNRIEAATFNVRLDAPTDGPNAWPHRRKYAEKMLSYYSWDLIGLQEPFAHQLEALAGVPGYTSEGIGREGGTAGEFSAILYKTERFERLDGGTFWLSETPDRPSLGWGADYLRICTWLKLRDRLSGQPLVAMNTHLDHMSEEARLRGAELILSRIDEISEGAPVILTGDFNAAATDPCCLVLGERLANARLEAGERHYGPVGTFSNFNGTLPWDQLEPIDHIFVSRDVRVVKTRTVTDTFDGACPSDHYPFTATLEL
ncbi:endonuclease/exonuclease/phosphatase family protein [Paenibacillus sp. CN-4]|uniref:endonuclease/exonuclease/phosphatase family protein n=1 Tax=Paenibacillus nanchangensis TaxID=3348343 RepID=UPI00397D8CF9